MPKKILIVEDEVLISISLKGILENNGYEVVASVRSGEDAIETCKKLKPDLILMDILLAGKIDGTMASAKIKEEINVPVVYITAHSNQSTLKTVKETQPYGYLIKPIQKDDLISTVEIALYKFETEMKILERDQRFRAAFEQAAVGMVHASLDGKLIRVNKKFCDIVGYSQKELLNINFQEITHPDDLDLDFRNYKKILEGVIETYSIEKRYIHKDGSNVWVLLTVSMVQQETDGSKYFVGVIQDIGHRKSVENALLDREEKLIESEERLRNVFDYSPNAIIVTDMKQEIIDCNQPCLNLTGIESREKVIGRNFQEFIASRDIERLKKNFQITTSQGYVRNLEYSFIKKNKEELPVQASISLIRDMKGEPISFINIIKDISEHLEMERRIIEIEESEREKIALDLHDGLGQQLTGIRYMLGQIIQKLKKKEHVDVSNVEDILDQVDILKNLTRDISRGFSSMDFEKKGFINAVEKMLASVKKMFDVNCVFKYNKGPENSNIAYHIYFIIKEVLTNSIKHGKADTLTIDLKKIEENINLKIKDNGKKIDYHSGDKQGMGLKIIKYRLAKIKGSMDVDNSSKEFNVYNFEIKDLE